MRWREDKEGIVMDAPNRIATVANMAGDGYLWRATRWGITNTQAEAMKQAEAALDESEALRALLREAHERCGFDLRARIDAVLR
jgi:hypothetical protein